MGKEIPADEERDLVLGQRGEHRAQQLLDRVLPEERREQHRDRWQLCDTGGVGRGNRVLHKALRHGATSTNGARSRA